MNVPTMLLSNQGVFPRQEGGMVGFFSFIAIPNQNTAQNPHVVS